MSFPACGHPWVGLAPVRISRVRLLGGHGVAGLGWEVCHHGSGHALLPLEHRLLHALRSICSALTISILLLRVPLRRCLVHLGVSLPVLLVLWKQRLLSEHVALSDVVWVRLIHHWVGILLIQPLLVFKVHPCVLRLRSQVDRVGRPEVGVVLHPDEHSS